MEKDFWIQKWKERKIGFHQESVHPKLKQFAHRLRLGPETKALLPLCGKTKDLLWFEEHAAHTLGIEISNQALEEFCEENSRHDFQTKNVIQGKLYSTKKLSLLCADFYNLPSILSKTSELHLYSEGFDIIYDRASNVALPPEMRSTYYKLIKQLLRPGGQLLLVSFSYNQQHMQGPPFSVPREEIEDAYREYSLTRLDTLTEKLTEGRFYDAGLREISQEVYLIES